MKKLLVKWSLKRPSDETKSIRVLCRFALAEAVTVRLQKSVFYVFYSTLTFLVS